VVWYPRSGDSEALRERARDFTWTSPRSSRLPRASDPDLFAQLREGFAFVD
jgi:hypothetical protein